MLESEQTYNYGKYSSSAYDELINNARSETDKATREQYLMDANALVVEDMAIIPIFNQGQAILQCSTLCGIYHNACGTPYIFKYITKA
ncbi:MAG: hypothetical protein LUH02_10080 [Erysipelotrichaceae bacterium]|nr:hypothetical protein [Erysipelotrichaceae bacterium]